MERLDLIGDARVTVPHRRVARVITRLNIGGPSIQAIDLSRELRRQGYGTLLTHGRLGEGEGDMRDFLPVEQTDVLYIDDLVRPVSPLHDLRALWRIYRALCRWRPEIIHTHMAKAGTLGRLAGLAYNRTSGRTRPAKLVHTYHGHVFEGYFSARTSSVFLGIERWLGRRTDALVAISPQIRTDIIDGFKIGRTEQVRLIPLGFNLDRLASIAAEDRTRARAELDVPPGARVVATVGRLTAIKQQLLFLDMAALLSRTSEGLLFLVVGDGELRSELEARAEALGISSSVRFLGWRGDLDVVYGATDVFVLTSRNEGTPVALIEAMASGVASVSTDVGGVKDVVTDPILGTLVPFGDADGLARSVRRLLDAPGIREGMGVAARAAVLDRFSLRRLVADIAALYDDLLVGYNSPALRDSA